MRVEADISLKGGRIVQVRVHKWKPLAVLVFIFKMARYSRKANVITRLACSDEWFITRLALGVGPNCYIDCIDD